MTPLAYAVAAVTSRTWRHRDGWLKTYRAAAIERQFVMASGLVAGVRLAFELERFYGVRYLAEVGCEIRDVARSWPTLMVRESVGVPFVAMKHILLDIFLRHPAPQSPDFAYQAPGKQAADRRHLDIRIAAMVKKEAARLLARREVRTVQSLLVATGYWQLFRHNRASLPMAAAEIEAFKRTDAAARKTGGREHHARRLAAIAEGRSMPAKPWSARTLARRQRGTDT